MIDIKTLKKTKIILKKDNKELSPEYFENLEEKTEDKKLKYFYRGCKHTLEKHFTEAIKWFQLVDDDDAILMILLNAYKVGDSFLFNEYMKENFKGNLFKETGITPFLKTLEKEISVNIDLIKQLKQSLEG
ncbi:MAG: hypothetical protein GXO21_01855 [Aquificae bacterium]|nr:hypothetical protein [Aquificota bacterium]